jgi:hypothetical protein
MPGRADHHPCAIGRCGAAIRPPHLRQPATGETASMTVFEAKRFALRTSRKRTFMPHMKSPSPIGEGESTGSLHACCESKGSLHKCGTDFQFAFASGGKADIPESTVRATSRSAQNERHRVYSEMD